MNEALDKLAQVSAAQPELLKFRCFVGLTFDETAATLGITVPVAKRWWAYARAWLSVELEEQTLE